MGYKSEFCSLLKGYVGFKLLPNRLDNVLY